MESTLSFDYVDPRTELAAKQLAETQLLPAGLTLHVALREQIAFDTSFEGDPVEGVLLSPVKAPHTDLSIPKGALLHGVLTRLESYDSPRQYGLASIQFGRLTVGSDSFLLDAKPLIDEKEARAVQVNDSIFIGAHPVRLRKNYRGYWITVKRSE